MKKIIGIGITMLAGAYGAHLVMKKFPATGSNGADGNDHNFLRNLFNSLGQAWTAAIGRMMRSSINLKPKAPEAVGAAPAEKV